MKWNRRDYHGFRSYSSDGPPGSFSLMSAWLANIAKRKLRDLRKFATRSPSSTVLLAEGERRFTLLGTSSRTSPHDRAADCPFPTRSNGEHNPSDWRVLP